jgi:hypothetical protein
MLLLQNGFAEFVFFGSELPQTKAQASLRTSKGAFGAT